MLHGIAEAQPESKWDPLWERVSPGKLDDVLGQLGKYYNFVSLSDAVAMLSGSIPIINNSLVLTFDDGYKNNVAEAWPVLKKHRAPGTFFVATGFIETNRPFWIDRLDYALQEAPDEARLLRARQLEFDLRGLSRDRLRNSYRDMRITIKNMAKDDDDMLSMFSAMSERLEKAAGKTIEDILQQDNFASVARWQELIGAADEGATIGSHSVDHRQLARIPRSALDGELEDSKKVIEFRLKRKCRYFCFPNGSFDDVVLDRTRKAGYAAALTTVKGLNRIGDDLYTLRRYALPVKATEFDNLCALSGLFEIRIVKRLLGEDS